MSKAVPTMLFKDEDGYIFAIKIGSMTLEEAEQLAKQELEKDNVELSKDYLYMYFGFGKATNMDEYENTWWITSKPEGKCCKVWAFR